MLDRRLFMTGAAAACLGGCTTAAALNPLAYMEPAESQDLSGEEHKVPRVDMATIPPQFRRQMINDPTGEAPGTIVVDPAQRYLYLVLDGGRTMRYGIGVGREGFAWNGDAVVGRKQKWPSWHPPVEMQARDERARIWKDGMPGGPDNPLGARALYLYQGNRDTLYRIHGTNEPRSIGKAVSSGCIRMLNADVIDLYDRVPDGTRVVVLPAMSPLARVGGMIPDAAKNLPGRIGQLVSGGPA